MEIAAKTCPSCGVDAHPVTAIGVGSLVQPDVTLHMPYQCRRGHRFVAKIETREFEPAPPAR